MRYLIDTHILIWATEEDNRLGASTSALLLNPKHQIYVSIVSLWEIAIKTNLNKLYIRSTLETIVPDWVSLLAIHIPHLNMLETLPLHHRDPFDRLLIAQAKAEGLTLVTHDQRFTDYAIDVKLRSP